MRDDLLLAAFTDGSVQLMSAASWTRVATLEGHSQAVTALSLHPTKNLMATVSSDSRLCFWTVNPNDVG